jgi:hypothetical protein
MRVILAGDEGELHHSAYPAFAAAGLDVEAVAGTPEALTAFAAAFPDAVVVADAALLGTPAEARSALATLPNPKAVILPQGWEAHQGSFAALPGLLAGFFAPVSWPEVVAEVRARAVALVPAAQGTGTGAAAGPQATPPPPPTPIPGTPGGTDLHPTPAPPLPAGPRTGEPARGRPVRIGFWGTRGGAGTSTAALTAARMLAGRGRPVLLCDATRRGDLHVMLGVEPTEAPVRVGGVVVRMGLPEDDTPNSADIIIDGGRARRNFNAEWVEVSRPLSEERIRRILGLPPEERGGDGDSGPRPTPTARRRTGPRLGFVRVEWTE